MASLNQIASICEKLPFAVTSQAQLAVKVILDGIVDDPHPVWKARTSVLTASSNDLLGRLPELLSEIGKHPTVKNDSVTTFDILHWLCGRSNGETNLDRLCPFDK